MVMRRFFGSGRARVFGAVGRGFIPGIEIAPSDRPSGPEGCAFSAIVPFAQRLGLKTKSIPQGLKPLFLRAIVLPGMNPRPTAPRFSLTCWNDVQKGAG